MKSLLRLAVVLLAVVMFVSPALVSRAQGTGCIGGLADADCQLFNAAVSNLSTLSSALIDYSVTASSGAPAPSNFNVKGNGGFAVDAKILSAGVSDPAAALGAVKFFTTVAVKSEGGDSQDSSTEVRIVGGKIYFKDLKKDGARWQFVEGATAAQGSGISSSSISGAMMQVMSVVGDPDVSAFLALLPGAIKATVADGPAVDGVATKKFTYDLDLKKLGSAPQLGPALKAIAKLQGATLDEAQLGMAIKAVTGVTSGTTISLSVLVDPAAKMLYGLSLDVAAKVDSDTAKSIGAAAIDFKINVTLQLSKLNKPITVEAPADAVDLMAGIQQQLMGSPTPNSK